MPPLVPAEESLKAEIIRHYHGADAKVMARVLNTPGPVEIHISNPALQPLFDSLSALRSARVVARDREARSALMQMRASLVLVAALPDSSAAALIVRRKTPDGFDDAIILAEGHATTDQYWLGVRQLISMRRGEHSAAAVDSAMVPRTEPTGTHNAAMTAQMADDLAKLRERPAEQLPGIGRGHRIYVFIART